MSFGNVKDILKSNGVVFDEEEFDVRMAMVVDALRGNYDQDKVDEFVRGGGGGVELPKVQYGGIRKMLGGEKDSGDDPKPPTEDNPVAAAEAKKDDDGLVYLPGFKKDSNDFLGPWMRWFVSTLSSPNAVTARLGLRVLLIVVFFVSYLENLPMVGGLLGAALDMTVGVSKAATKLIQTGIVTLFGIIPFGGLIGFMLATLFGWFAWTLISVISFSRQDFGESLSAIIHTAPYPMGNILGDAFDAGNQSLGKLQKNTGKIWGNIKDVLRYLGGTNEKAKVGVESLINKVAEARPDLADKTPTLPEAPRPNTFRGGRNSKNKWKTLRNKFDRTSANS